MKGSAAVKAAALPSDRRPVFDTNIRNFSLEYQLESGSMPFPFECNLYLRPDKDNAPYLKAYISADEFDVEPYVQENMADNRRGAWGLHWLNGAARRDNPTI